MTQAKNTQKSKRTGTIVKTAMSVLLTSAVLLLPTVRAQDATGDKAAGTQLSSGEIKAQRQFKKLDVNHDGKLSRQEVSFIPKLAAAFNETDTNKDGFVTYEEVRAYALKYRAARGLDSGAKPAEATAAHEPTGAAEAANSEAHAASSETK